MFAITHTPDNLTLSEVATPKPAAGQILVKVRAAGVNRADLVQRTGHYPAPPGASPILGLEVAGEVAVLGAEVTRWAVGDAVFGLVPGGGYAEYALLDDTLAIAKPAYLDWTAAASLPETWMTAWRNVVELGQLQAGKCLWVPAGASGVGSASIQLAQLLGARAIASVGSAEKVAYCQRLGATLTLNYHEEDVLAALQAAGGVDVIVDPVGGASLSTSLRALNNEGRLIVIAFMAGRMAEVDFGLVLSKRLQIIGSTLRALPLADKARLSEALRVTLLPALQEGRVQVTVDSTFPLAAAADAHHVLEANRNLGKVVLVV